VFAWDRVSAGAGARVGMGLGHGWRMCLGWCWMGQWPSTGVRIGTGWMPALVQGGVLAPVLGLARDRLEGGLREIVLGWDKFGSLSLSNRKKRLVFFFKQ
jgi:hypothetical protein